MYIVYALLNQQHKKIYIGQTENLEERLRIHNEHTFQGSFTSRYSGEWVVIYSESLKSRQDALRRERELKSYRGRQYIKTFIRG